MTQRLSKDTRKKISEAIEREEEAKIQHRKMMDERELRKLMKQTRMMKEAKVMDAQVVKHTKVKNILTKEQDHLDDNLRMMKSTRRCRLDTKQAQDISNLFAQGDDLDAAIAQEKNYIADLESQIRKDTKNIQAVKKQKGDSVIFGSDFIQKKESERAGRTLESWKSRLAAEERQLALMIKKNEEMRTKIKRLLREKGHFNKLFGELMGKLTRGKTIMKDVVDRSRQQFQKRDEIHRKIEALQSRDKVDLRKRMDEMQELEMKLYEDKKLAFFRLRIQDMRENMMSKRPSHKDTYLQEKMTEKLANAHKYWEDICEATGAETCEDICKYIVTEDSNLFRLFNYNNEIRDQVEVMTNKAAELVTTVNEESAAAEDYLDGCVRTRNLMEKTLLNIEQKLNDITDFLGSNSRLFTRLLDKIKVIFDMLKCSTSTLQELLGNNTKVTEHNYKLYLNLVEGQVIAVLETVSELIPSDRSKSNRSFTSRSRMDLASMTTTVTNMAAVVVPIKRVVTRPCFECDGGKGGFHRTRRE